MLVGDAAPGAPSMVVGTVHPANTKARVSNRETTILERSGMAGILRQPRIAEWGCELDTSWPIGARLCAEHQPQRLARFFHKRRTESSISRFENSTTAVTVSAA